LDFIIYFVWVLPVVEEHFVPSYSIRGHQVNAPLVGHNHDLFNFDRVSWFGDELVYRQFNYYLDCLVWASCLWFIWDCERLVGIVALESDADSGFDDIDWGGRFSAHYISHFLFDC
jgi:hypothetical protein